MPISRPATKLPGTAGLHSRLRAPSRRAQCRRPLTVGSGLSARGCGRRRDRWRSSGRILRSDADDAKQSLEGETLKAVERICQKCESKGRPHKFPALDGAYHAILVNLRTFSNGGDIHDRIHVALGAVAVAPQYRVFWNGRPVTGVFNPRQRYGAQRKFVSACTSWALSASAVTSRGNSWPRRNSCPIRTYSSMRPRRAPGSRPGRCGQRI